MPKIVDHAARREELAEAFWAVVLRDGVEAASVRAVAAQAACSPAALRYYFPTQEQLLDHTWALVFSRALARAEALDLPASPFEAALLQLEQSLPLDAERLAEAQLWFSVASLARTNDHLRVRIRELHETLNRGCTDILLRLRDAGLLGADRDTADEAVRLHALVDGLTFHTVMRPAAYPAERIRAALRGHVEDMGP